MVPFGSFLSFSHNFWNEGKEEKDSDIRNLLPMLPLLGDSLPVQGRGKVCVHIILPRSHLREYNGYVVVIVMPFSLHTHKSHRN